ncbi:MAG: hypothetical protein ACXACG_00675 [Candidatus Thorarchaeota archaeon]|jgi:hypothetical protein
MERIVIEIKNEGIVDLSQLYLTAYGFEVLSGLGMGLVTDSSGFEKIREIIKDLGYHLKEAEKGRHGANMSQEQMECISWFVENRGKPWSKEQEEDPWNE